MTKEQVQRMCFSDRGVDYNGLVPNTESDLHHKMGDTVYFRPLKEILSNPRVRSCEIDDNNLIEIYVDEGGSVKVLLENYGNPRIIAGCDTDEIYEDDTDISIAYYLFAGGGWADEYMVTNVKPILNRKHEIYNQVRYFR